MPRTKLFLHGPVNMATLFLLGSILSATGSTKPSVIQVRTQHVTPNYLGEIVLSALRQFEDILIQGALITIDEEKIRARILPLTGRYH